MKPFKKIAIAALAASVAGTALTAGLSAHAQSGASGNGGQNIQQMAGERFAHKGERGRGHRGGGQRAEKMFDRFDLNSDGVITEEEILETRRASFAAADADGNGEISLEEFKAGFLARPNDYMVRAFQFLDTDGDGTVTQEEADTAANRMFERLDRDGSGVVEHVRGQRGKGGQRGSNVGEREQAEAGPDRGRGGPRGMGRGRGGPAGMFMSVFDTNGDGTVTREDFDTRRAELFALADTNGSGSFTLDDFGPLWLAVNENRIVEMFQRADADGSLGITLEEHDKRAADFIQRADRNQDGVITKADFERGWKGKRGKGWGKDRG